MLQALRCPTCTAPIAFPPGQTTATCRYCGAQVRDVASPPGATPGPAKGALAEGLSIRTPSGALVPLLETGAALPASKSETLSTGHDQQRSLVCALVATGPRPRDLARLEVGLELAPRGVPKIALALRVDASGDAFVSLTSEGAYAEARFSLAVA
jgi:hypothetical protein